jgi:asparagine synthase (glutamine-hydrolysing)
MVLSGGAVRNHRWWRPEFLTRDVPAGEAHEHVRDLMADAVRLRLRSDVPLGVFLSGGVDSSVIAYEAAQVLGETVHSFTVATGNGLDESDVAGRTARALGIRSTVLPLEFDPLESLHTVVAQYDQPFADSSAIPSLALSRLARQHVTVVLNGDGGDEVFGGYRRHVAAHIAGHLSGVPDRLLGLAERGLSGRRTAPRRGALGFAQRIVRGLRLDDDNRYLAWSTDMLLDADKREVWRGSSVTNTTDRVRQTRRHGLSALDQQLATDIDLNLLSDLLVKMDMATMAHSLEGRSPFLDHRVAEYVWSLPAHVRLPRGRAKGLLRDSYRGRLSHEVVSGKKKGFEVPVDRWLAEDWRVLVRDVLTAPSAHVNAYVDAAAVTELVNHTRWPEKNTTYLVYALLVLELWLRREGH